MTHYTIRIFKHPIDNDSAPATPDTVDLVDLMHRTAPAASASFFHTKVGALSVCKVRWDWCGWCEVIVNGVLLDLESAKFEERLPF